MTTEAHTLALQASRDLLACERSPLASVVDQLARALVSVEPKRDAGRTTIRAIDALGDER